MTALRGWGLPEQHLAVDALVAFVDGELTPSAYDRAAAHLAHCQSCSAEATAQRQARAAVRAADAPSISSSLLHALQSIPTDAELPGQPEELALTEQGQLVAVSRHDRSHGALGSGSTITSGAPLGSSAPLGESAPLGSSTPLGGSAPLGESARARSSSDERTATATAQTAAPSRSNVGHGRRTRQGASVVFSGLVLGALAFMNIPGEEQRAPATTGPVPLPEGGYGNSVLPASARMDAPSPGSVPSETTSVTTSTAPDEVDEPSPRPSEPLASTLQP